MYVCLCHGFTDGDVRKAIADGCKSVAAVYRHIADRPQCGKCVPDVRSMVNRGGGAESISDEECCMAMVLPEVAA